MTKKELFEKLSGYPDDAQVMIDLSGEHVKWMDFSVNCFYVTNDNGTIKDLDSVNLRPTVEFCHSEYGDPRDYGIEEV